MSHDVSGLGLGQKWSREEHQHHLITTYTCSYTYQIRVTRYQSIEKTHYQWLPELCEVSWKHRLFDSMLLKRSQPLGQKHLPLRSFTLVPA
jgi:hypothetical protein